MVRKHCFVYVWLCYFQFLFLNILFSVCSGINPNLFCNSKSFKNCMLFNKNLIYMYISYPYHKLVRGYKSKPSWVQISKYEQKK